MRALDSFGDLRESSKSSERFIENIESFRELSSRVPGEVRPRSERVPRVQARVSRAFARFKALQNGSRCSPDSWRE